MRIILIALFAMLLASCDDNTIDVSCGSLDLRDMTSAQRYHAAAFCQASEERQPDTMVNRLSAEATRAKMPLEQFTETRVGQVALFKEVAAVVVGLMLVIGGWFVTLFFIRSTMWEVESAERKGWGIFSLWTVRYRRRKETFLDISTAGWLFTTGIIGLIICIAVYVSIAG